jgi:hypothetical protein
LPSEYEKQQARLNHEALAIDKGSQRIDRKELYATRQGQAKTAQLIWQ